MQSESWSKFAQPDFREKRTLGGCRTKFRDCEILLFFCDKLYTYVYIYAMNVASTPHSLLRQISQIQRMEPGKLCVIGQGPNGPYYNLQCREEGQTLSRYVRADQSAAVAEHTANYRRFQDLVGQYAQLVIAQTRAEREAGAKKKSPRPKSSWPRTRKSNN
jgi:hypothetical protein